MIPTDADAEATAEFARTILRAMDIDVGRPIDAIVAVRAHFACATVAAMLMVRSMDLPMAGENVARLATVGSDAMQCEADLMEAEINMFN